MSTYCSQSDVQGEIQNSDLIRLTDDGGTGDINATVLTQVIANASGEIDRMVGNRYQTPFNPVPPSVNSMAIIITCYRLLRRREVPDEKNKFYVDYNAIRDFLKAVKCGDEQLDLSVQTAYEQIAFSSQPSIFGGGNVLANSN